MCKQYEIYKAKTLIQMLIKRGQNPERALEIYNRNIYNLAIQELKLGDDDDRNN